MKDHLVIPDAHANPRYNNSRFLLAGNYIAKHLPQTIVCLGDWADMDALSSYDKGKKDFEGRRYKKDIDSANEALDIFDSGIRAVNAERTRSRKALYKPRKIMLLGNHEDRIMRATQSSPELDGAIGVEDIKFSEHGWDVVPFLSTINVDGIHYSHFFTSGVMGRPVGGENPASSLVSKQHVSCTAGHSHLLAFAERSKPDGSKLMGLVAGCLVDFPMSYAHATSHMWWRGIVHKHNVVNGQYDLETISLDRLKKEGYNTWK